MQKRNQKIRDLQKLVVDFIKNLLSGKFVNMASKGLKSDLVNVEILDNGEVSFGENSDGMTSTLQDQMMTSTLQDKIREQICMYFSIARFVFTRRFFYYCSYILFSFSSFINHKVDQLLIFDCP